MHLKSIILGNSSVQEKRFPFLEIIRNISEINFAEPVTFFVGENGSGKSTLLETIAAGSSLPTAGSVDIADDRSMRPASELATSIKFEWYQKKQPVLFAKASRLLHTVERFFQCF
jgi:predicted ATPase